MIVPLPEPEGPDRTISIPRTDGSVILLDLLLVLLIPVVQTVGDRFRLHRRQDDMVAVGDKDGPGAAAVGGVDQGPRSFASWMIRLIGADSGLTMATKRLAETMLPKPMLISFIHASLSVLFNVLDLLPYFFDFRFDIDHNPGERHILRLGANGIGLPVDFLNQEIQLASDRLVAVQHLFELVEMAAQADGLLRHGDLIREQRRLGQQPLFIHRRGAEKLPHPGFHLVHVFPDRSGESVLPPGRRFPVSGAGGLGYPPAAAPSVSLMAQKRPAASSTTSRTAVQTAASSSGARWTLSTSGRRAISMSPKAPSAMPRPSRSSSNAR